MEEHERRCVNTACVHAEPVPWCWHSQQQNHCSLSKSWKGRKKRKGLRVAGEEETQAGSSSQFQHLLQRSGRSSRKERKQRIPARLCTRCSLHPISPSMQLREAPAHLQLPRRTKLPPNPPLLPGQLQTSCFPELSSLGSLGEAPGVWFSFTFPSGMAQQSPAPGELLQPNRGFPTGAACKRREGREGAGINYTCANETPRTWREAVKGQSRGGSSASLCNLII